MAGKRVIGGVGAHERVVAEYVDELGRRLRGPRRPRKRILEEIADGFDEAFTASKSAGLSDERARSRARARFGAPATVADAFADELLTARTRQISTWLLVTGPAVGVLWLFALGIAPWSTRLPTFVAMVPVAPFIPVIAATALIVLARTGRLATRMGALGAVPARNIVRGVVGACTLVDATMIAFTIGTGHSLSLAMVAALVASTARIGACVLAWRITSLVHRG